MKLYDYSQHLTISSITHENIFSSFKCINHMVTKGQAFYINCSLARTKVNLRYLLLSLIKALIIINLVKTIYCSGHSDKLKCLGAQIKHNFA